MHKNNLQLKYNYSELLQMLNQMNEGFLLSDLSGRVFYANESVERISGVERDKIIGKTPDEMFEDGVIIHQSTKVHPDGPITMIHRISTGKEIFITSRPFYDEKQRIICFIANYQEFNAIDYLYRTHRDWENKQRKNENKKEESYTNVNHENWIGNSNKTVTIKKRVERVAKTEAIVLISGESGVGKEIVANNLHKLSYRKEKPYIQINCGAIPEELMEAELFGYEKGAFTGASVNKKGLLEAANGGTILLDEIGEMPLSLQVKLLRTIQTMRITPIGGTTEKKLDLRFIAATNKDLKNEVKQGNFREDLYYRLNVVPIHVDPLRKRREDILPLTMFFLRKFNGKYKKNKSFSPETLQVFQDFDWPGNVRQLENLIERLVIIVEKNIISPYDLPKKFKVVDNVSTEEVLPLHVVREEAEMRMIRLAINKYGSIRKAASHLKVNHSTIVRKMQKYHMRD